jgi:hypothetical protein
MGFVTELSLPYVRFRQEVVKAQLNLRFGPKMNFYPNSSLAGLLDILTISHSTISALCGANFIDIQDMQFKNGGEGTIQAILIRSKRLFFIGK